MSELDLSILPAPTIVEELGYETIVARHRQTFIETWEDVRARNSSANLPAYDVSMLETDTPIILGQAESYRDLLLRARVNEAARANLLAFAAGADLDHLAAFYDIARLSGELDERLKARVILAIRGRSTGGTEARYRSVALGADLRVADAIVYTVGRSPVIQVAIFSTEVDGIASTGLISAVNAALQSATVRMVNDTIVVASAIRTIVDLTADIWLLNDADDATVSRARQSLVDAWAAARSLGRDLTLTWWTSRLMIAGVHSVVPLSPLADVSAAPSEALSIGAITLNLKGRKF